MSSFTAVFGGSTVNPSELSYASYSNGGTTNLRWPIEATSEPLAARIIDVDPGPSLTFIMPDASIVSVGETVTFNNVGAGTFEIKSNSGTSILTVPPSTTWVLYLRDNSTAGGLWRAFQMGALVSNTTAAALVGPGMTAISGLLTPTFPPVSYSSNFSVTNLNRGETAVWSGANGTLSLPNPATLSSGWYFVVKNAGSGILNLDPIGTATIDAATSLNFAPDDSAVIITDGTNYHTIGKGGSVEFLFTFQAIDVSGVGDRVVAPSEYRKTALRLDGMPIASRNIVFPDIVNEYWVDNNTTYDMLLKTAAQPTGVTLKAGFRAIFYCDGARIVRAVTISPSDFGAGIVGAQLIPANTQQEARNVVDVYSRGETVALILALS